MKSEAMLDVAGVGTSEAECRALRVARYKEERRAQLASQFSALGAAPGDGEIRTTRTSRLRATAAKEAVAGDVRRPAKTRVSPGTVTTDPVRKKSDASITTPPGTSPRKTSTTLSPRKTSTTTLRRSSRDKISPDKTSVSVSSTGRATNGRRSSKDKTSPAHSTDRSGTLNGRRGSREKVSPPKSSFSAANGTRGSRDRVSPAKSAERMTANGRRGSKERVSPAKSAERMATNGRRGSKERLSTATEGVKTAGERRAAVEDVVKRLTTTRTTTDKTVEQRRVEKDKTGKRMSQLNLGLSHEAADPPEYLGLADDAAATRRRARRAVDAPVKLLSVSRRASSPRLSPPKEVTPATKDVRRIRPTRKSPPQIASPKHESASLPTSEVVEETPRILIESVAMPPLKVEEKVERHNNETTTIPMEKVRKISSPVLRPRTDKSSSLRSTTDASVSILKPTSGDEETTAKSPVSILKRKSSREENHAPPPPVTFSLDDEVPSRSGRTPGILKKHSSLDEAAVQRRRSCSPESKPILKRRSSLEELVRRAQSPDPQSILKRRESREEDILETAASPGILKRTAHVSIATAAEMVLAEQGVRPILKKISSDEYATADSSSDGTPRPILKKKSDSDEGRPKKTILKTSRKTSCEESYHSDSGRFVEEVRYLGRGTMSDDSTQEVALPRRLSGESELEAKLRKRRSLEVSPTELERGDSTRPRFAEVVGEDEQRTLSVADRINRMEGALSVSAATGAVPKRLTRDKERFKTQPVTREDFHGISSTAAAAALPASGAPLHRSQELAAMSDDAVPTLKERMKAMAEEAKARRRVTTSRHHDARFQTQPVTSGEVQQAAGKRGEEQEDEEEGSMSVRITKDKTLDHSQQTLRGILKPAGTTSARPAPVPDTLPHLRSVLKKESSLDEANLSDHAEHPRSILKTESSDFKSSSSDEESSETKPRSTDLTDILYGVEKAHAKKNIVEKENLENVVRKKPDEDRKIDLRELEKKINSKKLIDEFNQSRKSAKVTTERLNGGLREKKEAKEELNKLDGLDKCEGERRKGVEAEMSSEGESSGGREVRKIIRNEAVARRRQMAATKQRSNSATSLVPLGKSQSGCALPAQCHTSLGFERSRSAQDAQHTLGGLRRSMTQPMEDLDDRDEIRETSSIADRLAALKKSGNTGWQKRLPKLKAEDDLAVIATNNRINVATAPAPVAAPVAPALDNVVADRRGKLDAAAEGWRKRVGPSDAVNFSVAGRMREVREEVIASPILATERQKRTPRANRFRSKAVHANNAKSTPTSPQKDPRDSFRFKRSISAPGGDEDSGPSSPQASVVSVPRADDETFTSFFSATTSITTTSTCAADLDLDSVAAPVAGRLLVMRRRTVAAHRRRQRGARNPIKRLAARTDLRDEYEEVVTGVAEKEMRRIQVEKLSKGSNMAVEALAGLASREDFTAVSLRRAGDAPTASMLPYKELMLLQVKGRRHVQTRLVDPVPESVNAGDSYVLVTPTQVFNWIGRYSNVIERSRSAEVASLVAQRHDLGCSSDAVVTIPQGGARESAFWRALGAPAGTEPAPAGHPDEDEIYEAAVVDTNMVYEVEEDELVPVDEYWGAIPRIELLDPSKVLVLDFGSEVYAWSGRNAPPERRRAGVALAAELHEEGYDYTECDICPVTAARELGSRNVTSAGPRCGDRPPWTLVAKVSQHMETVLFREKFLDWPDFSRAIAGAAAALDDERSIDASVDVKPCDAQAMWNSERAEPNLELEGCRLGRGTGYFDEETHRHFEVKTSGVGGWHVDEFEHSALASSEVGQFYAGDSYVVRWSYTITPVGRELGGMPSKHLTTGRDRCAYFCWQGDAASLNEKGAAALITVELDAERGPQVRVAQGLEPPAFLSLFSGAMVVHAGRRADHDKPHHRLYVARGEIESEVSLVEVPCSARQLRSRGCLVLTDARARTAHVWHGCRAAQHARRVALAAARCLDAAVHEVQEGEEPKSFLQAIGGGNRQLYHSLLDDPSTSSYTPRLFHLTSASGTFLPTEVVGAYYLPSIPNAFPFLQSELYSASQPALFLLDTGTALWLWQGWDGAGHRWQAERRAAMQAAVDYWRAAGRHGRPRAHLVWAGLEPLEFTNCFPMWTDRDDVAETNMAEGRKPGEILSVETELARLTTSTYPIAQLLQRPLPDGVDPTRLELYLDEDHFVELLGMSKEEFEVLPTWKQTKVKKEAGLF